MRRRLLGMAVGVAGLPVVTVVGIGVGVDLSTALLCYLALAMLVATIGGVVPGLPTAVAGFAAGNWFFTPPYRTWTVDRGQDVVALCVFLAVAVVVSVLVHLVARRAAETARARAEAAALTRLAVSVADSSDPLGRLVHDLVATFGLEAAALLSREADGWHVEARAGQPQLSGPDEGTDALTVNDRTLLVLRGPRPPADDRRILAAFVAQLALAVRRQSLEAQAARAELLAEGNRLRTALLSAVSHDLRTPLSTIKAWLTGLLEGDVVFDADEVHEILTGAVVETDRLNTLVGNLLDMSRLQTGMVEVNNRPVALDAVTSAAVETLPHAHGRVCLDIPDTLPHVNADAALLERVIANLVDNALRHTAGRTTVEARADSSDRPETVSLKIVDHGPGIPLEQRARLFQPFQRLGQPPEQRGVGLGLAVASGLADAIRARLEVHDTPGGGTTMLLRLAAAP